MADIRINSLPTTASASSSDDFLALDGATNGTRKLNAYSPTFGGNLTVSGTGGVSISTSSSGAFLGATTQNTAANGFGGFRATNDAGGATRSTDFAVGGTTAGGNFSNYGYISAGSALSGFRIFSGGTTLAATFDSSGNTTLAGNLTVSGTGSVSSVAINSSYAGNYSSISLTNSGSGGTAQAYSINVAGSLTGSSTDRRFYVYDNTASAIRLAIAPTTGNLLLKSDGIDSGNGKLQLATHTTSAGGIGFGTDVSVYRTSISALAFNGTTGDPQFQLARGGTVQASFLLDGASVYFGSASTQPLIFRTNSTTALTLDSSQNATFAGRVISNGTGYGVGANSDANTPFNALTSINGTFGALIKNTNAGSSAFAGINIEADSGQAGFRQYSTAHSVWAGKTLISAPSGGTGLVLLTNGTGDAIDFWTNATQALSIDASQNIVPGTAALATTATNGFIYLQTCAGAPTGVPTSYTGRVASIYDTTNNKLYIYNGGWKSVTLA
jgi:hypothetical protein